MIRRTWRYLETVEFATLEWAPRRTMTRYYELAAAAELTSTALRPSRYASGGRYITFMDIDTLFQYIDDSTGAARHILAGFCQPALLALHQTVRTVLLPVISCQSPSTALRHVFIVPSARYSGLP